MADQQPGTNPAEPVSYDADMMADVRGAFEEVSKAELVADKPVVEAKAEPVAEKVVAETRADHPTDEKRYADGTFKPTKEEVAAAAKAEPVKVEPAAKVEPAPSAQQQPTQTAPATAVNPPGGWSPKSKSEWEKLPEHIRADIAKREKEVADGFAQYEGMRELRPYVDMARNSGRSLKQALDSYVATEQELYSAQPLPAILRLANVAGYSPQRLVQELAPQLGLSTGQQQGGYQDQTAQQPDPAIFQQWLNPLAQEISSIKSLFQQQSEAQRTREMTTIGTVVERFQSDPAHRYYGNVEPQMTQMFERGVVPRTGDYAADLKTAYDMACWQNPEIRELLISERTAKSEAARDQQTKEAAEKARQASRSITGSPSSGAVRDDGSKSTDSIEDDVRRAYRQHAA